MGSMNLRIEVLCLRRVRVQAHNGRVHAGVYVFSFPQVLIYCTTPHAIHC